MSKSSGIMKIDSPGKLGPGLNIDQDVIRKQIMAAKQVKMFVYLSIKCHVDTRVFRTSLFLRTVIFGTLS